MFVTLQSTVCVRVCVLGKQRLPLLFAQSVKATTHFMPVLDKNHKLLKLNLEPKCICSETNGL